MALWHIINRGVEKRKIFLCASDYIRFIHNLSDFNDVNEVVLPYRNRRVQYGDQNGTTAKRDKKPVVDLLCWCLMPNHYHLFVRERVDKGASIFSKKVTSGYTQYFNIKNERVGVLFQGRSKIIPIKKDAHFIHLPYYIFANPVKLVEPQWKDRRIRNCAKAVEFLKDYEYSSFRDLLGVKDNKFLRVADTSAFLATFDVNRREFTSAFTRWLCESQ